MEKIASSFSLIAGGLFAGWLLARILRRRNGGSMPEAADRARVLLQKSVLLGINPVVFLGAVWSLELGDRRLLALPLVGLAALASGLGLGYLGARLQKLPRERAGVYVTCASFTNIGNIGGLVVFLLLGEPGYAIIPFYKLFEEFWNYGVLFPVARSYGTGAAGAAPGKPALLRVLTDPFFLAALGGVGAGIALNLLGLPRPAFYGGLNAVLIPLSSFLFLLTIGMRLRWSHAFSEAPRAIPLLAGKALVVPAVALGVAILLGLGDYEGGLALQVVAVLAAGPVAFLGLVAPSLYRLDQDFASSLWIWSNGALVLTVPLLYLVTRLLGA
jgi:predicted permease